MGKKQYYYEIHYPDSKMIRSIDGYYEKDYFDSAEEAEQAAKQMTESIGLGASHLHDIDPSVYPENYLHPKSAKIMILHK